MDNIQTICICITGLHEKEVIIYSLSAAALVIVILLCIACKYRYKQCNGIVRKYRSSVKRRNNQEHQLPEIPLEYVEGVYDEIDEWNMIDTRAFKMDCRSSSFDTTDQTS